MPTPLSHRRGLHHRLFAAFQKWGSRRYTPLLHERKQKLFQNLSGTVLEVGPGTGVNFDYYPRDIHWIGVEPNAHMQSHLHARAAELNLPSLDLRFGTAEHLPADDNSVDTVVATLVLCSVADLPAALAEIRRILRPDGRFLFLEHVAAEPGTKLRRRQNLIKPLWKLIGDGCLPNRETATAIRQADFSHIELDTFQVPLPIVSPHITGVARKQRDHLIL